MQAYYGYLSHVPLVVEVFTSPSKPTPQSHPQYLATVGPFTSKGSARGAVRMSNRLRNAELRIASEVQS